MGKTLPPINLFFRIRLSFENRVNRAIMDSMNSVREKLTRTEWTNSKGPIRPAPDWINRFCFKRLFIKACWKKQLCFSAPSFHVLSKKPWLEIFFGPGEELCPKQSLNRWFRSRSNVIGGIATWFPKPQSLENILAKFEVDWISNEEAPTGNVQMVFQTLRKSNEGIR